MVMAHAGGESSAQALNAAMVLPNVYLDISVMQLNYKLNPDYFYRWLRNLIDWATPWKILFASDAPMPTFWVSNEEWVQAIKEPKTKEVKFTSEEIDIILGKAAEQVFDFS
jgi:predicted TIM-barrel fold metal-dependent hydrolase